MVFANKQDLPNALSVTELTEKLGLNTLRRKVRSIKRINLTYTGNNMMPVTYVTVFIDHISDSTHVDKDLTFGLGHFHKGITHWSATLGLRSWHKRIQQFNINFLMEVLYSYVTQSGQIIVRQCMTSFHASYTSWY